ncbi:CP4-57 prophage protein [Escherichia coli]|nr:CP4-57 prophage protein [Escherichia coli]
MRLASRFGYAANQIRRDRPLTHEELIRHVPSIFGEDRHTSRSERYAYIPTITVLENLQREGFQPFFACQTRVRDPGRRGYTKHMLRLRRAGEINGEHVPEIILLNSHDGTSSYQMLPGYFRFRLPERVRLWPVSGGSACSTPGKCSGESYRRGLRGGGRV